MKHRIFFRVGAGLALVTVLAGCGSFWAGVRERERRFALENAETRVQRGDCGGAMSSLERAQATADLGGYGAQSTLTKAECLDRLRRYEQSRAHYRLLRDFYPDFRPERIAQEFSEGDEFHELGLGEAPALGTLPALELGEPRYSMSADRSQLSGRVLIRFWVGEKGEIRDIRVLEMPHPLLASWAIEAVASSKMEKGHDAKLPRAVMTRFVFQTRKQRREGTDPN